jgi:HEAT repeat protein
LILHLAGFAVYWFLSPSREVNQPPAKDQQSQPLTADQIYKQLLNSAAWVVTTDGFGSGSLVHRKERLILTNYHVVGKERNVKVFFPLYKKSDLVTDPQYYLDLGNDAFVRGAVVAKDAGHDLALIQLTALPANLQVLSVAARSPRPGENAYSLGASGIRPGKNHLEGALWRYTVGKVRQVYEDDLSVDAQRITSFIVETDAPTNPGDSGGPVVNDRVQLVAVVAAFNLGNRLVSCNIDVREVRAFLKKHLQSVGEDFQDFVVPPPDSLTPGKDDSDDPRVRFENLVKDLGHPDSQQRLTAVRALAAMGADAQSAIPRLVPLFRDPDAAVRDAASQALTKIGPPAKGDWMALARFLKDGSSLARLYVLRALLNEAAVPRGVVMSLTELAKDNDTEVRRDTAMALGKFGVDDRDPVLLVLIDLLGDSDGKVRQLAAESLAKLGLDGGRDHRLMSEALKHKNPQIRVALMTRLVQGNVTTDVVAILTPVVRDADLKIRQLAVAALARAVPAAKDKAYAPLRSLLEDEDQSVRESAMAALLALEPGAQTDVDALGRCLSNRRVEVRLYAAKVLSRLGGNAQPVLTELVAALGDDDKRVRSQAAAAIGEIGSNAKSAVPQLIDTTKDSDQELRKQAFSSLGKIGRTDDSFQALIATLKTDEKPVREMAISTLAQFESLRPDDLPTLEATLKSEYPDVRLFCVGALGKMGKPAARLLIPILNDRESAVRTKAAEVLGDLKAADAVPKLTTCLSQETDAGFRSTVVQALTKIGPEAKTAAPTLGKILREKDPELQRRVLKALGAIGPEAKSAMPEIIRAMANVEIHEATSETVAKIGKDALVPLMEALKRADGPVLLGAVKALGEMGPDARGANAALLPLMKSRDREIREAAKIAVERVSQR